MYKIPTIYGPNAIQNGLQNPSTLHQPKPLAACELLLYIAACLLLPLATGAQLLSSPNLTGASPDQPYFIVERGPHTRNWAQAVPYITPLGGASFRTNRYTELQTGICYYEAESQVWLDSSPDFEIAADGSAVVRRCQHQLIVAPALASSGGLVDCLMPDGQRMRSSVAGLVLYCPKTGKSLQIGAIKNCPGEQTAPNEIIFIDAFDGMLKGSVRIRNEIGQFHQDILLTEKFSTEQLQKLADLGFDDGTRLEVWSEILSAPVPQQTIDATAVASTLDESIDFGAMQLIPGTGFVEGQEGESIPVSKTWAVAPGNGTYLIESVNLPELLPLLEDLPVSTMIVQNARPQTSKLIASRIPDRPANPQSDKPLTIAAYDPAKTRQNPSAVLVDYTAANGTLTNFVCQANATVYVSGLARIVGQLTLVGGTVVKLTNHPSATIIASNILCQTEPYRMATLTSKDDNSIGETIPGSTGSPTNYNGGIYLQVPGSTSTQSLSYVRFSYAGKGVLAPPLSGGLWHCQFVKCTTGIGMSATGSQWMRNGLFSGCGTAVNGGGSIIYGEHLSVDGGSFNVYSTDTLRITNSIFTGASLMGTQQLGSCTNYASASGVYQVAGAGRYYLPLGSADIDRGTPNITPELLSSLRAKTTSAPYIYASQMTSGVAIFQPQARREDGMPDRGYYYDPIDYAFGGVYWSNGIVTVTAGTVLAGCAEPPVNGRAAFGVGNGATFNTEGNPTNLVRIVRYNSVQEQSTNTWGGYFGPLLLTSWSTNLPPPQVNCRFTDFSTPAQDVELFRSCQANLQALPMNFKDCQFHGGQFNSDYPTINLTNCLLERVNCMLWQLDSNTPAIQNNLFYGGQLDFLPCTTTNAVIKDNLFDQVIIVDDLCGWGYRGGFNAYVTATNGRFCSTYSADIILANSPIYQVGQLGRFYQPTTSTLINADTNTTAGSVGLYHYTVCTNFSGGIQIKETNSWVDIGYHYVALGTNGAPLDSDLGGAPDYLEDSDGDGTVDTGESDYTSGHGSDDWQSARGILGVEYLRCEYRQNPRGVDTNYGPPRLYWVVKSGRRAQTQRAYQILVATSQNNLALNVGDMWDSKKVTSDATTHVEYKGSPLSSGQTLYWKVRAWDRYTDTPSAWSTNAFFQMGLLTNTDWAARWLTTAAEPGSNCSPMYRKAFEQRTNDIKRATLTVSAKGVYEVWIDGQRIGKNMLAPEWTDYNLRIQYQTFDVTTNLLSTNTDGTNHVIGAIVGEGWFHGTTSLNDSSLSYIYTNQVGGVKQLLVQLKIERNDASNSVAYIVTDSSWTCNTNGPIQFASIEWGEAYDARQMASIAGWSTFWYNPQESTNFTAPVTSYACKPEQMTAQSTEPIQIMETRQPIDMWTNTAGGPSNDKVVRVFDMGQNMAGWCSLSLTNTSNPSGTRIILRHAERLKLDPTNHQQLRGSNVDDLTLVGQGWPAIQNETNYILNTNVAQTFQPHFTYHSFRFVEVEAPTNIVLSMNSLTGHVIRSSLPITGSFTCSQKDVNQLMTNIMWTLKANVYGIYTACADRSERYGWFADTDVFSQTACYLMDMSGLYYKTLRDIRDEQWKETYNQGYYYYGAYAIQNPLVGKGVGNISTETGGVMRPWQLFQNYADIRALTEHYLSASNWVSWLSNVWRLDTWRNWETRIYAESADGGTFDGVPSGWDPAYAHMSTEVLGTCHYALSADILANMSKVLQRENNYASYVNLALNVRSNFQRSAIGADPKGYVLTNGLGNITQVGKGTQGDYAHALYFNMVPDNQRMNCLDKMLNDGNGGIVNYHTNHLSTGIFATGRGMLELTRNGYNSTAYGLLTDYRFPSWLYQITNGGAIYNGAGSNYGASTMWERWNGWVSGTSGGYAPSYSSFNQVWNGSVGEWIFKVIGGINSDDSNPGFKNVVIYVRPGGGITNATTTFNSIHGPIATAWTNTTATSDFTLSVTIPANTSGSIYLPSTNLANIRESGLAVTNAAVLQYSFTNSPNWANGATVFQVGSGTYRFGVTNVSF